MGFNLQLGDALRSESVTAIDDAIREIVRQEIARTPRTKFCDACAYMHQPDISARCCCVACHGDDVPAWAQRMNTPLSSEKTGDASPASEVKACPFCGGRARLISHESPEVTNYGYEVNCDECAAQGPSTDCEWDGNAEYAKRDAIAAWNRRAPAPSPESEVVLDMPETDSGPLGRAQLEALHRLLAPVLDAAGFSPAHETAKKAIERLLAQWRSGLEPRVPPSPASFSLNPGASKTPGSQQASEELDELLRMHARHDNDDTEDCWTKPAVRAIQYLSDLRWDLQVTTNRAAILAETNESLRRMIADMAAYAGTTFGADEPVKNCEVVKKALAPSPASGEGARMTTREREEILKNDEIALAIADGMARCADVFCDQAQLDRRREAARMTHKRLADSRELLADLRAEAVAAWAAAEAAEERCSYKACGCMYDRKDDVCSVHSPIVSKVTAERDAARSELAALLASRAPRPSPQPIPAFVNECPNGTKPQPSVEYDLYMATNRAAILSETIDSLHKMIETLAAEAGESHGVDEPVHNCAAVSRALAARDESQPSVDEMAERLYEANKALPTWQRNPSTCGMTQKAMDYFRALARAAIECACAPNQRHEESC